MHSADDDAPAERISFAYGFDSHGNEKRHSPVRNQGRLQLRRLELPAKLPVSTDDLSHAFTHLPIVARLFADLPVTAHSQTVSTRHPCSRRWRSFLRSRALLAANLAIQNLRWLFGTVER